MITYSIGCVGYQPKTWIYPAGEVGVRAIDTPASGSVDNVHISAALQSSDDIMELLMLTDSLKRHYSNAKISLRLGYTPYGRQDRVATVGDNIGVKVFASLINLQNYEKVSIYDPHSSVTEAVFDNSSIISSCDLLDIFLPKIIGLNKDITLIAPDAGAEKKALEIKERNWQISDLMVANKNRDPETGRITDYQFSGNVEGRTCLVVDDILDGGATFEHIAKSLREGGAKEIILYVTHGIFSKGHESIASLFDKVYTTNTYHKDREGLVDGVTYFKVF